MKCCGIIKNHGASIFVAFVCIIPHLSIYLSMSFEPKFLYIVHSCKMYKQTYKNEPTQKSGKATKIDPHKF